MSPPLSGQSLRGHPRETHGDFPRYCRGAWISCDIPIESSWRFHRYKPNFWYDITVRAPRLRCQTTPSLWALGRDQPVIPSVTFIRWATTHPRGKSHSKTTQVAGSLSPRFRPARLVGLTVRPACANTRPLRFPSGASGPLRASVTL